MLISINTSKCQSNSLKNSPCSACSFSWSGAICLRMLFRSEYHSKKLWHIYIYCKMASEDWIILKRLVWSTTTDRALRSHTILLYLRIVTRKQIFTVNGQHKRNSSCAHIESNQFKHTKVMKSLEFYLRRLVWAANLSIYKLYCYM